MGRWKREASDRLRFRNIHHSNPTNPQSDPHHAPTDPPTLSFIVLFDILYRISNHEFHFKRNSSISYLAPAAECWEHQTIKFLSIPPMFLATPITFAYLFHLPMSPFLQIFLRLDHGKVEERGFRSLQISKDLPRCRHSHPTNPQSDPTMHLPTLQAFLSS